jgi:predicted phage tail protein
MHYQLKVQARGAKIGGIFATVLGLALAIIPTIVNFARPPEQRSPGAIIPLLIAGAVFIIVGIIQFRISKGIRKRLEQ